MSKFTVLSFLAAMTAILGAFVCIGIGLLTDAPPPGTGTVFFFAVAGVSGFAMIVGCFVDVLKS